MNLPGASLHDAAPLSPSIDFTQTLLRPAHANPWSYGTSIAINGAIAAALLCLGMHSRSVPYQDPALGTHINLSDFTSFASAARDALHGGGGGGGHDLVDPITGRLPDRSSSPLMHPQVALLQHPQLAVTPTIVVPPDVKLPDNPNLPNFGVYRSSNTVILSSGPGAQAGIGSGSNGGVGPGKGIGWGTGSDQGTNGGVYTPGRGGVTAPIPLFQPQAEFSDEARRVKYQGVCLISLIVDAEGTPQSPRVIQPLGMGLDEKALEAVRRYRFKPARKEGKPVPVMITIAVNFRLF